MRLSLNIISAAILAGILTGCVSSPEVNSDFQQHQMPTQWQSLSENEPSTAAPPADGWLSSLKSAQIHQLVQMALANNNALKQQALAVEIKQQQLVMAGANLWPSLDLSFSSSRSQNAAGTISDNNSLELGLSYELDLWGKLSDADQEANLLLLAQKSSYQQAQQTLVADVVTSWFSVIEAKLLTQLYQQRADKTQQNLDIIESGYRQGLNGALDVYLARNEMNSELARTSAQHTLYLNAVRKLELLVGQYPSAAIEVIEDLPLLNTDIPTGLPSDLIARKPDILASWYQVLAQDANLAFTHKQRFPSIRLTASTGNSSEDLSDLLSVDSLAWSLVGGVSAPLFNAGKLKASEQQARLLLRQKEQVYLDQLQQAFSAVESGISRESSLKKRYQLMLKAEENAKTAEQLSFAEYQNGLVEYTTVLEAQKRSYDAQSSLIEIKQELIANRIQLHIALGGDFANSDPQVISKND